MFTDPFGYPTHLRGCLETLRARGAPDEVVRAAEEAVARITAALEADPTLVWRSVGDRAADLAGELIRQMGAVARQSAPGRPRPVPDAAEQLAELLRALERCTAGLEAQVWSDWDTPAGRERLAELAMPAEAEREQLAERVRAAFREAAELGHPEARRMLALADDIAPDSGRCAGPGCERPLARRATGRPARYCSPACRQRTQAAEERLRRQGGDQ